MTAAYDPELCARLIYLLREGTQRGSPTADQLEAAQARIAELENDRVQTTVRTQAAIAEILERESARERERDQAVERIAELERTIDTGNEAFRSVREAHAARILQLEESARTASENWMAACRERDEARAEVERLTSGIREVHEAAVYPHGGDSIASWWVDDKLGPLLKPAAERSE